MKTQILFILILLIFNILMWGMGLIPYLVERSRGWLWRLWHG